MITKLKSFTAKQLAKASNLPIFVINESCRFGDLNKFFKLFTAPVCCIFDEVEKNFNTESLLGFLDGIEKTAKKLVIMTCNDRSKTSKYLEDRCSRIRYAKNYTFENNLELLDCLLEDSTVKDKDAVRNFIKERVTATSVDNISSIIEEVEMFQDEGESIEEIVQNMSITISKKQQGNKEEFVTVGNGILNQIKTVQAIGTEEGLTPILDESDFGDFGDYDDVDDYDEDEYDNAA